MLPDMDGIDILRRLRAVSDLPVVVVTARLDALVWDDPTPAGRATGAARVKFAVSRLRGKLYATALGNSSIVSARGIGYLYRPQAKVAESGTRTTTGKAGYGHANQVLSILNATSRTP